MVVARFNNQPGALAVPLICLVHAPDHNVISLRVVTLLPI